MSTDLTIPLGTGNPMGSHRRQAKARQARQEAAAAEQARPYVAPDPATTCAARQVLGSRVCDLHPGHAGAHEGAGPRDARDKFWSTQ